MFHFFLFSFLFKIKNSNKLIINSHLACRQLWFLVFQRKHRKPWRSFPSQVNDYLLQREFLGADSCCCKEVCTFHSKFVPDKNLKQGTVLISQKSVHQKTLNAKNHFAKCTLKSLGQKKLQKIKESICRIGTIWFLK